MKYISARGGGLINDPYFVTGSGVFGIISI
jgi:hypothetical protein